MSVRRTKNKNMNKTNSKKYEVIELKCPDCKTVRMERSSVQAYFDAKKLDSSVTPYYTTELHQCKQCRTASDTINSELIMQSLVDSN